MVFAGPGPQPLRVRDPAFVRKADSEWQTDLVAGKQPPRPEWTASYLVPGVNPQAQHYKAMFGG